MLRTRPRTSKRQFDKMQISFVSLTTIGFSASSFFSISFSSYSFPFSSLQPFSTSSFEQRCPSRHWHLPHLPACTSKLSLFSLGYFVFLCASVQPLWSACTRSWAQYPQEFTTRKTEVVKMTVCEFQSLYLVDLYIAHVIHSKKNLTVSIEYIYI